MLPKSEKIHYRAVKYKKGNRLDVLFHLIDIKQKKNFTKFGMGSP